VKLEAILSHLSQNITIVAMYSQPFSITAQTFSDLPSYLKKDSDGNTWVANALGGRETHSYLSGPVFDARGNLWLSDCAHGRIFRVTPTGEWDEISHYEGWPSALQFHPDGRLIIADARHGLLAMDVASRAITPLLTQHQNQRFKGVADLAISSDGNIYFTDAGQTGLQDPSGALFCLFGDGQLRRLASNLASPSGIAVMPDQRNVYVASTTDNAVYRITLFPHQEGQRTSRYIALSGGIGPCGLALDTESNLYVAHAGMGSVWVFDKRGEPKYRVESSRGDLVTHITISTSDTRQIFMTEAQTGCILQATLPFY
jgi:gluconolactonase